MECSDRLKNFNSAITSNFESKNVENEQKPIPLMNGDVKKPIKLDRKVLGVTSPIDISLPSKVHLRKTRMLHKKIDDWQIKESDDIMIKSMVAIDKLNQIFKSWLIEVLRKARIPECEAIESGGHIRTFGSYRLGIQGKGGDIDAVAIAPMHVYRHDFFKTFPDYLNCKKDVTNLRVVPEAYVPVVKFNFCGFEFDLLFARLITPRIDDNIDLNDVEILRGMDERCIRSINGFKVAELILSLVPSQINFRTVLLVIKKWAKAHGIYSNILGFLGGISWAILVARVCQLYPTKDPACLINKFFTVYKEWKWSSTPVILQEIKFGVNSMTLPQWHPNEKRRNKLMSIVTPSYPEQNTCHNISLSTLEVIRRRLTEASIISSRIVDGDGDWDDLFKPKEFFRLYPLYFVVTAVSKLEHKSTEFHAFIESKLRRLVMMLESNLFIRVAHVNSKWYPALPGETEQNVRRWFIGADVLKPEETKTLNLNVKEFFEAFYHSTMVQSNCRQNYPDKDLLFCYAPRKEIHRYLPPGVIVPRVRSKPQADIQDLKDQQPQQPNIIDTVINGNSDIVDLSLTNHNETQNITENSLCLPPPLTSQIPIIDATTNEMNEKNTDDTKITSTISSNNEIDNSITITKRKHTDTDQLEDAPSKIHKDGILCKNTENSCMSKYTNGIINNGTRAIT